jgi:anti-sigma factor RsiW
MTCGELVDFLMAYLDGELSAAQRTAFEHHLGECPECEAYLRSYRDTVRLGKTLGDGDDPLPADVPEELVQAIVTARGRKT